MKSATKHSRIISDLCFGACMSAFPLSTEVSAQTRIAYYFTSYRNVYRSIYIYIYIYGFRHHFRFSSTSFSLCRCMYTYALCMYVYMCLRRVKKHVYVYVSRGSARVIYIYILHNICTYGHIGIEI